MGYYNTSVNYLNILIPVVCLEIWSAIMRYMFDYDKQEDRYKSVYNGLAIFACSVAAYTAIFVVLDIFMDIQCLWLIYLYGLFTMLQNVYTYSARGLGYNTTFAVSGLVGSLVNCLSNIFMILVLHMTLESLYIAMIIGLLTQVLIMESKVRLISHCKGFHIEKDTVKSMTAFALPLALNSACFWFLSGYNSVAITNTLGLEANGIYAVAGKFTTALSLVSTCFTLAWQELVFSMGNEKEDKSAFYTKASNYYILFLYAGLLALVPFIKLIFPIMIDDSYSASFMLVPLYLLATVASIYSNFLGQYLFSGKAHEDRVLFHAGRGRGERGAVPSAYLAGGDPGRQHFAAGGLPREYRHENLYSAQIGCHSAQLWYYYRRDRALRRGVLCLRQHGHGGQRRVPGCGMPAGAVRAERPAFEAKRRCPPGAGSGIERKST
jgi:O-antigen/teichoic acid export membrane protein